MVAVVVTKELVVSLLPALLVPMLFASKVLPRWSRGRITIGESFMFVVLACCVLLVIAMAAAFWASCVASVLGFDTSPFAGPRGVQAEASE